MGEDSSSSNSKPIILYNVATFKQIFGESLKDVWGRINKLQNKDPSPCSDENLQLYFYYGLEPWYQNALDIATGGSFPRRVFEQGSAVAFQGARLDTLSALSREEERRHS